MPEQKSVFVHSEEYHSNGADVLVYKALVPIPCYRCHQNILPGDLFRRSASKDGKTVGIRYVLCRQCEPFEKKPEYLAQKQLRVNESARQEQLLLQNEDQGDISWKKLARYELVQINLDEYGNASFTDQMGLPLYRGEVAWIIRVAKRYLELYTDEEIESEWQSSMDELENPPIAFQPKKKKYTPGYIYLMSGGGFHKIGKSTNLQTRHKQIGLKLPFKTSIVHAIKTSDIDGLESYWHSRFADKRGNGEWFTLSAEDIEEFKAQDEMEVPR